jgi:hypothetical protein
MRTVWMALLVGAIAVFSSNALGQNTRSKGTNAFAPPNVNQAPLYSEYKGVQLGMTEQEVHAKLGQALKVENSDFYVFSDKETAQIAYDASHKVTAISVDYVEGIGAPDYKTVVGPNIEVRPDGSLYKIVHYDQLGFWVSYNRTGRNSPVATVSITIQKILR